MIFLLLCNYINWLNPSSLPLYRDATTAWPTHGGTVGSSTAQRLYCRNPKDDLKLTQLMRVTTVKRKTHFMVQR